MGYQTTFNGTIEVVPPLNPQEIEFLHQFAESRRVHRHSGPYTVSGGPYALSEIGGDVINGTDPPPGQPGLWCDWEARADGTGIEWNDAEKFYDADRWMAYIIRHFIGPDPEAKRVDPKRFAFLQGHTCNGTIEAQGEEAEDRWDLIVDDNDVFVQRYELRLLGARERVRL